MATEEIHHAVGPGMKEFFTGVHLLILMALIYFGGRRGVMTMIRDRSRSVEKEIVDARVELEKMKHETDRARQEIAQISKTRDKFIAEIKDEGDRVYDTMVNEAKLTSQRILADAKLAADNEVQSALLKVKEEIVNLAVDRAVKLATESSETRSVIHKGLFDKLTSDIVSKSGELKNGL